MCEDEGEEWVLVRRPTEAEMMALSGREEDAWSPAATEEQRPLKVVFTAPAPHWTDAAPIGNGRLGAMVWGGVPTETLRLNRKHLFPPSVFLDLSFSRAFHCPLGRTGS